MDVHALGAPLGFGKRAIVIATSSLSFPVVSGYHTGGATNKDYFPSLPFALD